MPKDNTIRIKLADEGPEPNTTLLALLRDGEKRKPGDPRGTMADRLGGEVQGFLAEMVRVARHTRGAAKGSFTLTCTSVVGPDGSHQYAMTFAGKPARIKVNPSMGFIDEDGDLVGRPVEPLTELAEKRQAESKSTNPAEPKVGKAANL